MTELHVHEGRIVTTWAPHGVALGLVTGKLHTDVLDRPGFEVDWIVRFPASPAGTGEAMCAALLPALTRRFGLTWVALKIHDAHAPTELTAMAQRFGFAFLQRVGPVEVWRKELAP